MLLLVVESQGYKVLKLISKTEIEYLEYNLGENRIEDAPIKIDEQEILPSFWHIEFIIESNG